MRGGVVERRRASEAHGVALAADGCRSPRSLPASPASARVIRRRHVRDLDDRLAVGVHQRIGDAVRLRAGSRVPSPSPRRSRSSSSRSPARGTSAGCSRPAPARRPPRPPRRPSPSASGSMRSVCRQHSYMSVPGITCRPRSGTSGTSRPGGCRTRRGRSPRPNRPPAGSMSGTRSTSRSMPPGIVAGSRSGRSAKSAPNAVDEVAARAAHRPAPGRANTRAAGRGRASRPAACPASACLSSAV